MKCPKCSYISFDYNQVCPKCNKDIAEEQKKLNLPGYQPEPPFLLGALTGTATESQIGIEMETFKDTSELEKEIAISMDDTGVMDRETVFGKGEEFQVEETLADEMPAVDLSDIEREPGGEAQEGLTVDLADLAVEAEETGVVEEPEEKAIGTGTLVLEDVRMENREMEPDTLADMKDSEEISLDLDEISDDGLEAAMAFDKEDEELSLELEDLTEETEGLEEIELQPADTFPGEPLDLAAIDFQEDGVLETDTDLSHSDSEMLTLELDSDEKKGPGDLKNLRLEELAKGTDTSDP